MKQQKARYLNREIGELGVKLKTAGMFEKPAIAERMLRKQMLLNELLIEALLNGNNES